MSTKYFSNMLTSWLTRSHCRTGSFKRRATKYQPRVAAEVLEVRQVLAATAVLQGGVLTITGSNQADNIVVTKSGTNLVVSDVSTTFVLSKVKSIVVNAGDGNDTVDLSAVNLPTKIFGGAGQDSLTGGSGKDTLMGESGNDVLRGNAGNDSLNGGSELDLIRELANANFVLTNTKLTGVGTDTLTDIETASLEGGAGKNRLDAAKFSGQVTLHGGAGNDTLVGGLAGDEVFGELGDDVVDGNAGIDMVDGVGRDTTKNSERMHGQVFESHAAGPSGNFVLSDKWGDPALGTSAVVTYSFMPSGIRDILDLDGGWTSTAITEFMPAGAIEEIRRAFAAWSQVANIRFIEVPDGGESFAGTPGSDIRIGGHVFDGPSGTLAHGFFPPPGLEGVEGDIHFDIAENWAVNSINGDPSTIDIFSIAAHEIGHAIGLDHELNVLALMNPFYNEAINGLLADDIQGVQTLYGLPGEAPQVDVSVNDAEVTEGNQGIANAVFTITLSSASVDSVRVDYATADGTAASGNDYVATQGSVVFEPGETSKTVSVSVRGDADFESNETFLLRLTTSQATLSDSEGQATIINDDSPPLPPIQVTVSDAQVTEGNQGTANAVFTVTLSRPATESVRVNYTTADGTAVSGSDYVANQGALVFQAGERSKTVSVSVRGDTDFESNETFLLRLTTSQATLSDSEGQATIVNDDSPPLPPIQVTVNDAQVTEGNQGAVNAVFTITLSRPATESVRVNYTTADGTAVSGSDYVTNQGTLVFQPGERSKTVSVSVRGDTVFESNETFLLRLTSTQVTLSDSEGQGRIVNDDREPFALHTGTPLHETGSSFTFLTTDWNRDGRTDLVAIGKSGTGTRTTEVHILDGATNYQTYLLHTGTALGESDGNIEFDMGDWNRDGRSDLFVIQKQGTGTHSTEVHILDGASNFQTWLLHTGTPLHETGNNFEFKVADWNRDGRVDVVAIIKSQTGSGTVEVHVLDGASTFQNFSVHTGTGLIPAGNNTFEFELSDVDRDGITDLVAIQRSGTGSHTTELHVLSGRSGFQSFIVHSATGLSEVDSNYEFDYFNGQIFAIKKFGTGTNSTEVHIPLLI